ncbi:MAG TPA: PQQ-binding-like beta-propeller repeat protein, partial [Thermoanaerobaculaceae bacterium]|nr:PQQ-binding-like beta-propeller repeat protein [Thermoanaerobaculaceae bacterium]
PAFGPGVGYFLQAGTLRGVALANNTVLWSFAGDGSLVTSPIAVNQYVVVGSSLGKLYGLDGTTGSVVWTFDLGAPLPTGAGWGARMPLSGLAAGNGLLVVPAGTRVTAFTLAGH